MTRMHANEQRVEQIRSQAREVYLFLDRTI